MAAFEAAHNRQPPPHFGGHFNFIEKKGNTMNHEKIKDEPKALIARPKLENKDLIIFTYVRRYLDKIPGSQGLVETLRNSF